MTSVEIRGFGDFSKLFQERNWPYPLFYELKEPTTTGELAKILDLSEDKIEVVFVNGLAWGLDYPVKPGDRVAFVPPGTPGPYRIMLGFVQKRHKS